MNNNINIYYESTIILVKKSTNNVNTNLTPHSDFITQKRTNSKTLHSEIDFIKISAIVPGERRISHKKMNVGKKKEIFSFSKVKSKEFHRMKRKMKDSQRLMGRYFKMKIELTVSP